MASGFLTLFLIIYFAPDILGLNKVRELSLSTVNINLTLSWRPPSQLDTTNTVLYKVFKRSLQSGTQLVPNCNATTLTSCNLLSVMPLSSLTTRNVDLTVTAYYSTSPRNKSSKTITFRPLYDVRTGPPVITNDRNISSRCFNVTIHGPLTPYQKQDGGGYFSLEEKIFKERMDIGDMYYEWKLFDEDGYMIRESGFREFNTRGRTKIVISDLAPITSYRLTLNARLSKSHYSVESTEINFITKMEAPKDGPVVTFINVINTTCDHRDVEVFWKVSNDEDIYGKITSYEVSYVTVEHYKDKSKWKSFTASRDTRSYTIPGLSRWSSYAVRVFSCNAAGKTQQMEDDVNRIHEDKFDETDYRIQGLTCTLVKTNHWNISWIPSSSVKECIVGYFIEAWKEKENEKKLVFVDEVFGYDQTSIELELYEQGRHRIKVTPMIQDTFNHSTKVVSIDSTIMVEGNYFHSVKLAFVLLIITVGILLTVIVVVLIMKNFCYVKVDMTASKVLAFAKENKGRSFETHFSKEVEEFDSLTFNMTANTVGSQIGLDDQAEEATDAIQCKTCVSDPSSTDSGCSGCSEVFPSHDENDNAFLTSGGNAQFTGSQSNIKYMEFSNVCNTTASESPNSSLLTEKTFSTNVGIHCNSLSSSDTIPEPEKQNEDSGRLRRLQSSDSGLGTDTDSTPVSPTIDQLGEDVFAQNKESLTTLPRSVTSSNARTPSQTRSSFRISDPKNNVNSSNGILGTDLPGSNYNKDLNSSQLHNLKSSPSVEGPKILSSGYVSHMPVTCQQPTESHGSNSRDSSYIKKKKVPTATLR